VAAHLPDGRERHWELDEFARTTDQTIQVAAGTAFEIPLYGLLTPGRFALLELRNGIYVADATKQIALPPMGPYREDKDGKSVPGVRLPFIPVDGLPAGDYRLLLPDEDRSVEIKVSKGTVGRGLGARFGARAPAHHSQAAERRTNRRGTG
jgi:hypothetical protein